MARIGMIVAIVVIVASGAAVLYQGYVTRVWIRGLVLGVLPPALAIYEWLAATKASPKTQQSTNRLVLAVMLAMLGLARPGFESIESRIRGSSEAAAP
jgi:hypothetical protein